MVFGERGRVLQSAHGAAQLPRLLDQLSFVSKCDHVRPRRPVQVTLCLFSGIITPKVTYEEATDLDKFITSAGILMFLSFPQKRRCRFL